MGIQMNKNDVVLARIFSSDIDARMAQSLLEDAGIKCVLDNETFSRIYPIGFNSIGGIRLMVFESDLERAEKILTEAEL